MHNDWASENLQVIRTLMERSAVYRRAMAPVMIVVGLTGIAASVGGACLNLQTARGFVVFWLCVAVFCLLEAFMMVRRQALTDSEPVWSPPTRRAAQAVAPAFFSALMAGFFIDARTDFFFAYMLIPGWMTLYGLAMHSAGFIMLRGFKLFGWGFVLGAGVFVVCLAQVHNQEILDSSFAANLAMGGLFGCGHLAYGIYLYFTEKRGNVA